jgi:hypothetical protein
MTIERVTNDYKWKRTSPATKAAYLILKRSLFILT